MLIHNDVITRGRQDWTRTVTATVAGQKVRVVIDRDSYDFQSRIFSEVFSPTELKWNRVQTLEGTEHGDLPSYVVTDETQIMVATNGLVHEMFEYAELILL